MSVKDLVCLIITQTNEVDKKPIALASVSVSTNMKEIQHSSHIGIFFYAHNTDKVTLYRIFMLINVHFAALQSM